MAHLLARLDSGDERSDYGSFDSIERSFLREKHVVVGLYQLRMWNDLNAWGGDFFACTQNRIEFLECLLLQSDSVLELGF